ncbi:flavin reductase [Streptomyces platensis]|uniref:Flavin reductase n=1 Tax=Streptomyces platensis TaxID=58346 RepID=A0AAE6NL37_STRPT|nr:flavin reductase family protein [Streptomyces platensis]OSY47216.1 Flavin reductase (NADPH) [Streptomyces platensis]QEV53918.1 flavin reductase [Streptomyces platensis]
MASLPPPPSAPDTATRPVPADGFRSLMGAFPTGVAVITTYGADDRPRGLTCSSLSSVTTAPPTLSVWLTTRGETLGALRAYGAFAVNLLHDRGERAGEVFAHRVADRFAQVGWRRSPDAGLPWLADDAFAVAECRVMKLVEVSDHTLVVGAVTGVTQQAGTPLLYGARRFASWPGGEVPAAPLAVGTPVTSC